MYDALLFSSNFQKHVELAKHEFNFCQILVFECKVTFLFFYKAYMSCRNVFHDLKINLS